MRQTILLPVGIDDFQKIIAEGYYFVDKSELIAEIIDDSAEVILLPRPRRFGKTLNLSMLYYYFSLHNADTHLGLFKNLLIARAGSAYASHQGKYPVIFLTLKSITDGTYAEAFQTIQSLMSKLYEQHDYLLESTQLKPYQKQIFQQIIEATASEIQVRNSLQNLIAYLHHHHGIKPILLLDEYDSPIHTSYTHNYYEPMVQFMQAFLGESLKGNLHLHKAVITGILRVAQASIFSGLNNIVVCSLLSRKYSQHFGFLEEEVTQLNNACGAAHAMAEIRDWYNGYQFGNCHVYNPWSILNCLYFQDPPRAYWVNVANNTLIKQLVSNAKTDLRPEFERLLQGEAISQVIREDMVFPELTKREEVLWSLLLFTGYLTIAKSEVIDGRNHVMLKIPNKEVQYLFEDMVTDWFSTPQLNLKNFDALLQSLIDAQISKFEYLLQAYIRESGSYFDFNLHTPEQVYHAFVLGLVVGLRDRFYIQSNRESGDGRFDVCLLPKNPGQVGILIEFKQTTDPDKLEQTSNQALAQIMDKQYDTVFRQHETAQVLCLGIAFSARNVKICAKITDV